MTRLPYAYLIGLLVGFVAFAGCSENSPDEVFVDQELQVYFDSFEFEAELRGMDVDLVQAEIEGYMRSIDDLGVVGQCIENSTSKSIVIDIERWQNLDQLEKEFIVFHELGHCYLDRGHIDSKDNRGTCTSMMHSSSTVCDIRYNSITRSTYIDELFLN